MPERRRPAWTTQEGKLLPWVIQIAGFGLIGVAIIAWWVTRRETHEFVGAGMLMVLGGELGKRGSAGSA